MRISVVICPMTSRGLKMENDAIRITESRANVSSPPVAKSPAQNIMTQAQMRNTME